MRTPKTVVHLFHDDADSIRTGVRVAQRVAEVALDRGVEIEVFCFGPAQRLLARRDDELGAHLNTGIDALIANGTPVGACITLARADDLEVALRERKVNLAVARDEFIRFTLEAATVVTF